MASSGPPGLVSFLMLLVGMVVGGVLLFALHPPHLVQDAVALEQDLREQRLEAQGDMSGFVSVSTASSAHDLSLPRSLASSNVSTGKKVGDQMGDGVFVPGDEYSKALLSIPKITYETCLESLKGRDFKKRKPVIEWLHFPKCGSSFATAIYTYLCQETSTGALTTLDKTRPQNCSRFCGPTANLWDYYATKELPLNLMPYCDPHVTYIGALQSHFSLPVDMTGHRSGIIGNFRDPRRRLVSAFNDNKHSFGIDKVNREKLVQNTPTLASYVRHPNIQSCQTKMLLGTYCGQPMALTRPLLMEARRRVDRMAFVGLTEYFNQSVCLFYHRMGGTPYLKAFTTHVRSQYDNLINILPGGNFRVPSSAWRDLTPADDPYDWEIYQYAKAKFVHHMREAGLMPP